MWTHTCMLQHPGAHRKAAVSCACLITLRQQQRFGLCGRHCSIPQRSLRGMGCSPTQGQVPGTHKLCGVHSSEHCRHADQPMSTHIAAASQQHNMQPFECCPESMHQCINFGIRCRPVAKYWQAGDGTMAARCSLNASCINQPACSRTHSSQQGMRAHISTPRGHSGLVCLLPRRSPLAWRFSILLNMACVSDIMSACNFIMGSFSIN